MQIVIWSFSGYADALRMTLGQLKKYVSSEVPLEIVVLADKEDFVLEIWDGLPRANGFVSIRVVPYQESDPFWRQIGNLKKVRLENSFLFMQEDFVPFDRPDWKLLSNLREEFRRSYLSFIRLVPSGHQNPKPGFVSINGMNFVLINQRSAYHHSWQATFWKRRTFFFINALVRPRSIRSENNGNYRKMMRLLRVKGIASLENLLPYVQTAIRRGKWDFDANPGGELLPSLLEEYGVNPEVRGIRKKA